MRHLLRKVGAQSNLVYFPFRCSTVFSKWQMTTRCFIRCMVSGRPRCASRHVGERCAYAQCHVIVLIPYGFNLFVSSENSSHVRRRTGNYIIVVISNVGAERLLTNSYLVDSASSRMLGPRTKPCKSKYAHYSDNRSKSELIRARKARLTKGCTC